MRYQGIWELQYLQNFPVNLNLFIYPKIKKKKTYFSLQQEVKSKLLQIPLYRYCFACTCLLWCHLATAQQEPTQSPSAKGQALNLSQMALHHICLTFSRSLAPCSLNLHKLRSKPRKAAIPKSDNCSGPFPPIRFSDVDNSVNQTQWVLIIS